MMRSSAKAKTMWVMGGLLGVSLAVCPVRGATAGPASGKSDTDAAVHGLVRRLIPQHADQVAFETIATESGQDVFEIAAATGKGIVIRGSSPVAKASGFHWYLKHVAKCHVSWCGDQLDLPKSLLQPEAPIRRTSPYKYGYNFNFCTFYYTMPWWDWARWEREIDYMALCGINMPLAIVGSEALWLNVLKRFNYSHEEAKAFISGPAYNAWWLMGNLEGSAGPITDEWLESRVVLQKRILARMRELGIRPVLPAFVGLVPTTFKKHNPEAVTIPQGAWGGNARPHVLHPDSPLFPEMAKVWYEELNKLYGPVDAFTGDLFHEGGQTKGLDIGKVAHQVQGYMLEYNPASIWTIMGWGSNPKKQLLTALDKDHTLVVELCCEYYRNWGKNGGFWGYPWTFSTIFMFGGNVSLHSRMAAMHKNLNDALKSPNPPIALGTTWESIEINPVSMDYMWDMRWRNEAPELQGWFDDYAVRRYGVDVPEIKQGWNNILETVYTAQAHRQPQESIFCAKPLPNVTVVSPCGRVEIYYDQIKFQKGVELLLSAADKVKADCRPYQFDAVDTTRQFLTNTGMTAYRGMMAAFNKKDKATFESYAKAFLELLDDQNALLATEELYLLGHWLHDARSVAPNEEQANQNERNARLLISVWDTTPQMTHHDYSWREWNGMLERYYKPRWVRFIELMRSEFGKEKPNLSIDYRPADLKWAQQYWATDSYPHKPSGDPVATAKQMMAKWGPWATDHTRK